MHLMEYWAQLRTRLVWAYEAELRFPVEGVPTLPHPTSALLVRSGWLAFRYADGQKEVCKPGEWVFLREAEGWQTRSANLRLLSLRFQAEWAYGAPLFDRGATYRLKAAAYPDLGHAAERLVELLRKPDYTEAHPGSRIVTTHLPGYLQALPHFHEWLACWHAALSSAGVPTTPAQPPEPKVRLALDLLERHPLEMPMREPALARAAGCSVSQLNKLCLRHAGATPTALWNRRRLNTARAALLQGGESVKALAYRLGFSSPEHFTRWFGNQTGLAPSRFRQVGAEPV